LLERPVEEYNMVVNVIRYKISYEVQLSKNNARKYTVQYYYLEIHNVDPCERITVTKQLATNEKEKAVEKREGTEGFGLPTCMK
jgi:hypothetical protein